jgi:hypothetical protein
MEETTTTYDGHGADQGDVSSYELGIGFETEDLDAAEQEEALAELEAEQWLTTNGNGAVGEDALLTLPDETLVATAPITGDDGDVGSAPPGLTYDTAAMTAAEDAEELTQVELGQALPDEGPPPGPPAPAPAPNGAFSADGGDVAASALGLGYAPSALAAAEADDDALAAIEAGLGSGGIALPGETTTVAVSPGGLVDQPSKAPSRKVKAAGLGGVLGAIPAPILSLLNELPVPDPVLAGISSTLAVIGSALAAYAVRERQQPTTTGAQI